MTLRSKIYMTVQELDDEGSMPPDSDTGSGAPVGAPKRRKRSQPGQPHYQHR